MSRSAAPNEVKVFRTDDFSQVATIPVGNLPHGVWPSGDGTRVYVGLENADALAAIDTATNTVIANIPIGQAPQAIAYVPDAAPNPDDRQNLQALGVAGQVAHLALAAQVGSKGRQAADQRIAVRPGSDPGAAGLGHRPRAQERNTCWRSPSTPTAAASLATACGLHDQSGGIGHRQCDRPDPADRPERRRRLSGAIW